MQFSAHLKRGSAVDRMWRGRRQLGGKIAGVAFQLVGQMTTGVYSAGELSSAEVAALRYHDSVQLEAIGAPAGEAAVAPTPERGKETEQDAAPGAAASADPEQETQRRRGRRPKAELPDPDLEI
jgi:hypothetical protein